MNCQNYLFFTTKNSILSLQICEKVMNNMENYNVVHIN